MTEMHPCAFLNHQGQWGRTGPQGASPLVNGAPKNQQHGTVDNGYYFGTFNSVVQPSVSSAMTSKNLSQRYQQTYNSQTGWSESQWRKNLGHPQASLPNNQFLSSDSQSMNYCFPSTSRRIDQGSYGTVCVDQSKPPSHYTTSTSPTICQQPLVPRTANEQPAVNNQFQDVNLQKMAQSSYGLSPNVASFQYGITGSSPLNGQLVSCNPQQYQQVPYRNTVSYSNNNASTSSSLLNNKRQMGLFLSKTNEYSIDHAVKEKHPSSVRDYTPSMSFGQNSMSYSPNNMGRQSVSQPQLTLSHSNRPIVNTAVPGICFANSSNSSSLHQGNVSVQCTKTVKPPQNSGNNLVAFSGSNGMAKRRAKSPRYEKKPKKETSHFRYPSQTRLPTTNKPGRKALTQSFTGVQEKDCSLQAASASLSLSGTRAVAVVPPLSQQSLMVSRKQTTSTPSKCSKDQEQTITKSNAEVDGLGQESNDDCQPTGSSLCDPSSTQKSNDFPPLESTFKNVTKKSQFRQNDESSSQAKVTPEVPVEKNVPQHQRSSQTERKMAPAVQSSKHDPLLVETCATQTDRTKEVGKANKKPGNTTEMLILKHGEDYSETPYKSSWLNLNEQLDDIDKEFGFPWPLRRKLCFGTDSQMFQEDPNVDSAATAPGDSPNRVSLDEIEEIVHLLTELQPSLRAALCESESDDSCQSIKVDTVCPELAKEVYEETCRGDTLEPILLEVMGTLSMDLKEHFDMESLTGKVKTFNSPEFELRSSLSKGTTKISDQLAVEAESAGNGEEGTHDQATSPSFSDLNSTVESPVDSLEVIEDEDISNVKENSLNSATDSDFINLNSEENTFRLKNSKNLVLDTFLVKNQCKNKDSLHQEVHRCSEQQTNLTGAPSAEVVVKDLQGGKPKYAQIENIEDVMGETASSQEENCYSGIIKMAQIQRERDCQQNVENCAAGGNRSEIFMDGIRPLSSQDGCPITEPQNKHSEDPDSQLIIDECPLTVEVVHFSSLDSSQSEQMDDVLREVIKVTEEFESSNKERNGVLEMSGGEVLLPNPEVERPSSLPWDGCDSQTQRESALQDSDRNAGQLTVHEVKAHRGLDQTQPSNSPVEKRKRRRERDQSLHFAKTKHDQAEDPECQQSMDFVSKGKNLVAHPSSIARFVKLSLYGKSQQHNFSAIQTSLKPPQDIFIRLSPKKSFSEPACTDKYSVKDHVWEKWRQSFVPTNIGLKGKPRNPTNILSRKNLSKVSQKSKLSKRKHRPSLKMKFL